MTRSGYTLPNLRGGPSQCPSMCPVSATIASCICSCKWSLVLSHGSGSVDVCWMIRAHASGVTRDWNIGMDRRTSPHQFLWKSVSFYYKIQFLKFEEKMENRLVFSKKPFGFSGLSIGFDHFFIQNSNFEWKTINWPIFLVYHLVFLVYHLVFQFSIFQKKIKI
jgi:hypothetical protein